MGDFNSLKAQYDALLAKTLAETDASARAAYVAELKTLNEKMADAITQSVASSGDEMGEKREILLAELARIQYDYNGLQEGGDKLKTLQQLRDYQNGKRNYFSFSTYEFGLGIASLALLVLLFIRR
jgi:hypothetical protein